MSNSNFEALYTNGHYFEKNATWHIKDSAWKTEHILRMIRRNDLRLRNVCEVGCGAGEILRLLQLELDYSCDLLGYEISPQAFALCQERANDRLQFKLGNFLEEAEDNFDLVLCIDLIEHLEDYYSFLRQLRIKGHYKIFHIPLDLSVQTVLRCKPILASREQYGHIHYFTKELALQSLADTGYEVLDFFYTQTFQRPTKSFKRKLAKWPRGIVFNLHQDWAIRLLGGASLMVLAK